MDHNTPGWHLDTIFLELYALKHSAKDGRWFIHTVSIHEDYVKVV